MALSVCQAHQEVCSKFVQERFDIEIHPPDCRPTNPQRDQQIVQRSPSRGKATAESQKTIIIMMMMSRARTTAKEVCWKFVRRTPPPRSISLAASFGTTKPTDEPPEAGSGFLHRTFQNGLVVGHTLFVVF